MSQVEKLPSYPPLGPPREDPSLKEGLSFSSLLGGLASLLWAGGSVIYLSRHYGSFTNISLLLPHEIGGISSLILLPPALLWIFLLTNRRSKALEDQQGRFAWMIERLLEPTRTEQENQQSLLEDLQKKARAVSAIAHGMTNDLSQKERSIQERLDQWAQKLQEARAFLEETDEHLSRKTENIAKTTAEAADRLEGRLGSLSEKVRKTLQNLEESYQSAEEKSARFGEDLRQSAQKLAESSRNLDQLGASLTGPLEKVRTFFEEAQETLEQSLMQNAQKSAGLLAVVKDDIVKIARQQQDSVLRILDDHDSSFNEILKEKLMEQRRDLEEDISGFENQIGRIQSAIAQTLDQKEGWLAASLNQSLQNVDNLRELSAAISARLQQASDETRGSQAGFLEIVEHYLEKTQTFDARMDQSAEKLSAYVGAVRKDLDDMTLAFAESQANLESRHAAFRTTIEDNLQMSNDITENIAVSLEKYRDVSEKSKESLNAFKQEFQSLSTTVRTESTEHIHHMEQLNKIFRSSIQKMDVEATDVQRRLQSSVRENISRLDQMRESFGGFEKQSLTNAQYAQNLIDKYSDLAQQIGQSADRLGQDIAQQEDHIRKNKEIVESVARQIHAQDDLVDHFSAKQKDALEKLAQSTQEFRGLSEYVSSYTDESLQKIDSYRALWEEKERDLMTHADQSFQKLEEVGARSLSVREKINQDLTDQIALHKDHLEDIWSHNEVYLQQTQGDMEALREQSLSFVDSVLNSTSLIRQSQSGLQEACKTLGSLLEETRTSSEGLQKTVNPLTETMATLSTHLHTVENGLDTFEARNRNLQDSFHSFLKTLEDGQLSTESLYRQTVQNFGQLGEDLRDNVEKIRNSHQMSDHLVTQSRHLFNESFHQVEDRIEKATKALQNHQTFFTDITDKTLQELNIKEGGFGEICQKLVQLSRDITQSFEPMKDSFGGLLNDIKRVSSELPMTVDETTRRLKDALKDLNDRFQTITEDAQKAAAISQNLNKEAEQIHSSAREKIEGLLEKVQEYSSRTSELIATSHEKMAHTLVLFRQGDSETQKIVDGALQRINFIGNSLAQLVTKGKKDTESLLETTEKTAQNFRNIFHDNESRIVHFADRFEESIVRPIQKASGQMGLTIDELSAQSSRLHEDMVFIGTEGKEISQTLGRQRESLTEVVDQLLKASRYVEKSSKGLINDLKENTIKSYKIFEQIKALAGSKTYETLSENILKTLEVLGAASAGILQHLGTLSEEEWERFIRYGDTTVFIRHLSSIAPQLHETIKDSYRRNPEVQQNILQYIHAFEDLARQFNILEGSPLLKRIFFDSDVGKLYAFLAVSINHKTRII